MTDPVPDHSHNQSQSRERVPDRDRDPKKFPVMELFGPTIQGEGAIAGVRSHFIRFGGCPFRCRWCDSMHAVDPARVKANARWLVPEEIVAATRSLGPSRWVTLTGGDPVMWDHMELIKQLGPDFFIAVETQGSLWKDWLLHCNLITISPKGPSSGMRDKLNEEVLLYYVAAVPTVDHIAMKIVVFNDEDLQFAREMFRRFPMFKPYLSVGTPIGNPINYTRLEICNRTRWLYEEALKCDDLRDVTVIPQLHVLAWGNSKGV